MRLTAAVSVAVGLCPSLLSAQTAGGDSPSSTRPVVALARVSTPPAIDGSLDDAPWQQATRLGTFVQQTPTEGAAATEATDVFVAYDSEHVYFGFHAHYSDPGLIRANRAERDQIFKDDLISVYFDTFLDQQRAYVFSVNGFGVQGDEILRSSIGGSGGGGGGGGNTSDNAIYRGDASWDELFRSAGVLVADGWTAEVAIPFKSLRYPTRDGGQTHTWGFQVARTITGKDETAVWSPVSRNISGFLTQMGLMQGMESLSTSRNMEILPVFTAIKRGQLDRGTGAFVGDDADPQAGLNVKYGLTSNLTLDFTFNPDFSQIESDQPQIEVNQRFALSFPEQRPFFLEGGEIFQMPAPATLVHTRTIVDPQWGAKVTGKVGNVAIGVILANDEQPGRVAPTNPGFDRSAQVLVGRARYDLYAESHIGALFTNREFLDSSSRLGGIDGNFRLGQTHLVQFTAMQSQRRMLDGGIQSGPLLDVAFKRNSRNIKYGVIYNSVSPGFGTDVGFVRRVDTRNAKLDGSYKWWPQSWVIGTGPRADWGMTWDHSGVLQNRPFGYGWDIDFAKSIKFTSFLTRDMERYENIDFMKVRGRVGGTVNTNRRVLVNGQYSWGDQIRFDPADPFLGREVTVSLGVTVRPVSRFQSDISLRTSRLTDPRRNGEEVFDIKILRALSTYQLSERLLLRNISEYNTLQKTLGLNLLVTYRINSGTAFFAGYDDRYQRANLIEPTQTGGRPEDWWQDSSALKRTNRAFFTKISYLFRY